MVSRDQAAKECVCHRVVDDKGAGALDQLRRSTRIARTNASRLT
jgi:hypothetical protein